MQVSLMANNSKLVSGNCTQNMFDILMMSLTDFQMLLASRDLKFASSKSYNLIWNMCTIVRWIGNVMYFLLDLCFSLQHVLCSMRCDQLN